MFTCIRLVIYSVVLEDLGWISLPFLFPFPSLLCWMSPSLRLRLGESERFDPYLRVSPLPGFQYSCSLFFIPVDVGNLLVASKVLEHLLGSHQLEHGL